MKTNLIAFSICLLTLNIGAEDTSYKEKMAEAIAQMHRSESLAELQQTANQFSVIARMNPEQWLPLYHEGYCYIIMNFVDESGPEAKEGYLDRAELAIEKMMELKPEEAEIHALHAFYLTGRLVVDPMNRGQSMAPMIAGAFGKALALDPENPRARYVKLSNEMGTARFFGSDITPYCREAKKILEEWDAYPVKSELHPDWGKDLVGELAASCTENE